ncbi:hypothetical protein G7046_g4601 [Stylonectria norvegica]|nr:hypothetical protein G7046_g4601 [Stylonectria norvegica]
MTGEKSPSENSANPTAVRIRDNQRRSRARHKEYVEGLQRKIQDHERRGVEATLEMQQAARNVAVENSRLRILLGYHNVTNDEIDKFLQTFPDQPATDIAKATISQSVVEQQSIVAAAPKRTVRPLQPLSRPSSAGPPRRDYLIPDFDSENSTRDVVDAAVGIRREPRNAALSGSRGSHGTVAERRQPQLQPRHPPSPLPTIAALVLGPPRPDTNPIDKLSVLANASVQQDFSGGATFTQPLRGNFRVPSPHTLGQSPASSITTSTTDMRSESPRDQGLGFDSPGRRQSDGMDQMRPGAPDEIDSEIREARLRSGTRKEV